MLFRRNEWGRAGLLYNFTRHYHNLFLPSLYNPEFSGFPSLWQLCPHTPYTIMAAAIKYSPAAASENLPKPVFIERSALRMAVMMSGYLDYGSGVVCFRPCH